MMIVWFRVIGQGGKPTGHVGVAFGANVEELFWSIDEFVDPFCVETQPAICGGFCLLQGEGEDDPDEEHEVSGHMPSPFHDERWRTPSWARAVAR